MLKKEIDAILENTKRSLTEQYLDIQIRAEKQFGEETVVLIEVGSFFEVYGVDTEEMKIGKPKEIADLLNIQLTRKNKSIAENSVKNPLLAGFPSAAFERYVQRILQENRYTIVLIRQRGNPPHVTRYLDQVISPGVNFDFALDHRTTFTTSLVISSHKGIYAIGYSAIDVTTGAIHTCELQSTSDDPTRALDDLFTLLHTYRSVEFLLTLENENDQQHIIDYLELQNDVTISIRTKRLKLHYQNELLKKIYSIESLLSPIEVLDLERYPLASEATTLLFESIIEHDATLLNDISYPHLLDTNSFLYLGNNPLEQLQIISSNPQLPTVIDHIDKTLTSGGKRLLTERLLHPITNATELNHRYDLVNVVQNVLPELKRALTNMYDIERLARRIALGRLHPCEMNFLDASLQAATELINILTAQHPTLEALHAHTDALATLTTHVQRIFDLDQTTQMTLHAVERSFFQSGFDMELDALVTQQQAQIDQLDLIRKKIISVIEETTQKEESDFVAIKKLDKEGYFLNLTKNRYAAIEASLRDAFVSVDGVVHAFSDFSYAVQKGNVKISGGIIHTISQACVALEQKIIARTKELYLTELARIHHDYGEMLSMVAHCIARIDVAYSTARTADEYGFYRPTIVTDTQKRSFLEALKLRHPLVESNEDRGIYVPNDVVMGCKELLSPAGKAALMATLSSVDVRGVMLYGINSSGKSSLMKSVGIAIVLAQSGFFVPARSFRYTLFTELCTRIVAQDNVTKGLSSFAVEMLEMKNIFRRCGNRSLVLGDEVSHGTETTSAIAIVAASVLRLSEKGGLFLFATHLHQLQQIEEIRTLNHLLFLHVAVRYDAERNVLIFNRTLQEGSGDTLYGLEFAQSLSMDEKFLQHALRIRTTLTGEKNPLQKLTEQETSSYNRELFLTECALCHGTVEDTHHIREQHTADEKGFIDHFPKDHKGNIIPLCKKCHVKVHQGKITLEGYVMTSKGFVLQQK